jgi:hypothetical protein
VPLDDGNLLAGSAAGDIAHTNSAEELRSSPLTDEDAVEDAQVAVVGCYSSRFR